MYRYTPRSSPPLLPTPHSLSPSPLSLVFLPSLSPVPSPLPLSPVPTPLPLSPSSSAFSLLPIPFPYSLYPNPYSLFPLHTSLSTLPLSKNSYVTVTFLGSAVQNNHIIFLFLFTHVYREQIKVCWPNWTINTVGTNSTRHLTAPSLASNILLAWFIMRPTVSFRQSFINEIACVAHPCMSREIFPYLCTFEILVLSLIRVVPKICW